MLHPLLPVLLAACAQPFPPDTSSPLDSVSDSASDTDTVETPPDTEGDSQPPDDSDSSPDSDSGPQDTGPWTRPDRPETDAPSASDSWRFGGGDGYPDVVDPTWPVVTRVADATSLAAAVGAATAGTIIYVEDDAQIDLTGQSLCLGAGVWLASDRGVAGAPGGLLYATEGAADAILTTCGDGVRITGLRIRGPDPETCPPEWPDDCPNDVSGDVNCAYCTDTAYGISTTYDGLEVDNNELSGWTYAAVGVHNALDADVHHNWIHHDWREGLGYGVVLYGADPTSALIRWNRFQAMRHSVAGQGYPAEDYEARDNLVESAAIGHVFDMHGEDEATDDGTSYAGGDIRVHANIVLVPDQYSLVVRGRPDDGSWFYDNCVAPPADDATLQRYFSGNFYVDEDPSGASSPGVYDASSSDCDTVRWCLSDGLVGVERYGSASGTAVADMRVGDLDGDGKDDVFNSTGSAWRFANPDGGSWATLATSGTPLSDLALVDLDGDGTDDVFNATGTTWRWSKSGTGSWATLKTSSYGSTEVGFGDFNGDGAVDVFTTDGTRWSYHPGGSGDPVDLAVSGVALASLAFGDFDGDGVTDVFYGTGAQWRWSRSGASSWADLAASSATVTQLQFADVDGDGRTDVLSVADERLRVSWAGASSWETLRYQHEALDDILLGDFDGDGSADLLVGGCL